MDYMQGLSTYKLDVSPTFTVLLLTAPSHSFLAVRSVFEEGSVGLRYSAEKVKEKSRECHNHKLQPFPDTEEE